MVPEMKGKKVAVKNLIVPGTIKYRFDVGRA